jgi:hypothetical protein
MSNLEAKSEHVEYMSNLEAFFYEQHNSVLIS